MLSELFQMKVELELPGEGQVSLSILVPLSSVCSCAYRYAVADHEGYQAICLKECHVK